MSPIDNEDDSPVGRPIQAPRESNFPKPNAAVAKDHDSVAASPGLVIELDSDPRPDEGLGRPTQPALDGATLTDIDCERIRLDRTREDETERRQIEELLTSEATIFRLPALLAHSVTTAFLIGMAALLGLFLLSQVNTTLAALASLPDSWRYAGYCGLTLLTGCLIFAFGRCVVFYFRLRSNRPVMLKGLEQLSQRTRLRRLVHEKKNEARQYLVAYLQSFPVDLAAELKFFSGLGMTEEKLRQMQKVRADLLDMNRFASNDAWLERFEAKFQAVVDEAAEARIAYFARRVAVMTAVSPNALVDTLLTGYCSFMMLADLCRLYNLRLGRLGTTVLLGRVFFNAYVAGQLNDFESVTETGLESFWAEIGVHVGSQAADATVGRVVGKVGSRTLSGTLNYLLLRRLGRYAARSLRPVQSA